MKFSCLVFLISFFSFSVFGNESVKEINLYLNNINNCSDLGEDECETVVFCDWNEEEGMCVEYDWGGGECEDLNYA